jgi:hypothetical protein
VSPRYPRRLIPASGGLLLLLATPLGAQDRGPRPVDVAVLPMDVGSSRDPAIVRLAEQCVTKLVSALQARKVTVSRAAPPDEAAARLTVHGSLAGDDGAYTAELRLLDGGTGDELRSYMYGPGDAAGVVGLAERAAPRIAAVVEELRAPGR